MSLSRRQLLHYAGLALLGGAILEPGARARAAQPAAPSSGKAKAAARAAEPIGPLTPLHRFPRAVQEYYVQRVRAVEREANARRAALRTRADAERYVAEVRAKIQRCFGPLQEKTPLNARVTAVHPRDGYKIENVIFESRPAFPVTANLYVPAGRAGPFPGVVAPCGHSPNGKTADTYQAPKPVRILGQERDYFDARGFGMPRPVFSTSIVSWARRRTSVRSSALTHTATPGPTARRCMAGSTGKPVSRPGRKSRRSPWKRTPRSSAPPMDRSPPRPL